MSLFRLLAWGAAGCAALLASLVVTGCTAHPRSAAAAPSTTMSSGLEAPARVAGLSALCDPPIGWPAAPLKCNSLHVHETWVSPGGASAYGVIHFFLPLPVGYDLALWGFLDQMKRTEGEANLLSKSWDSQGGLLRFEAEGGQYHIRAMMILRGFDGWVVYAGTLRREPVVPEELDLAVRARELTVVDVPDAGATTQAGQK